MAAASEADFRDITEELGPDELQRLFHNLGISQRDIEHAEKSADTTDTRLTARAVLRQWKKKQGSDATLEALLEAKRRLSRTRRGRKSSIQLGNTHFSGCCPGGGT